MIKPDIKELIIDIQSIGRLESEQEKKRKVLLNCIII